MKGLSNHLQHQTYPNSNGPFTSMSGKQPFKSYKHVTNFINSLRSRSDINFYLKSLVINYWNKNVYHCRYGRRKKNKINVISLKHLKEYSFANFQSNYSFWPLHQTTFIPQTISDPFCCYLTDENKNE